MDIKREARLLKKDLMEFRQLVLTIVESLKAQADQMDGVKRAVDISKTVGSSAAVAGGILSAIGFGLSFVTAGASLGLIIVGGVVGGAGGVTAGGAGIGEAVNANNIENQANDLLTKIDVVRERLLNRCYQMSTTLQELHNIEEELPGWSSFWSTMFFGTASIGWGVVWNLVMTSVQGGIRLADLSMDVASGVITVFRTMGRISQGFHIAGGVVGALFLPLDIGMLVYSAIDVANATEHEVSKKLRCKAKDLKNNCIKENDIDKMISELIKVAVR